MVGAIGMDKVKIVFYENYGNKRIKTIHNVIPTSITMDVRKDWCGRKEKYLRYTIEDVIKHDGSFTLSPDTLFSVFADKGE